MNKVNGKIYIGQTIHSLEKRIKEHKRSSSSCPAIKSAIEKYGIENFEIKTLIKCKTQEELDSRENFCIRIYGSLAPNGYNLKLNGKGKGLYSDETKNKISTSVLKNHHTKKDGWVSKRKVKIRKTEEEKRLNRSKGALGKKMSEEARRKMSEAKKGKKLSEEHKLKIKTSLKQRYSNV